jgi:hypothetical protein
MAKRRVSTEPIGSLLALVAIVLAGTLLVGCTNNSLGGVTGSGRLVDRDYDLSNFTRVQASSSFQVEVVRADDFEVMVTADDNVIDSIVVDRRGDTLELSLMGGSYRNATLRAQVRLPELRGISLSGSSDATVTGFASQRYVDVELSGSSRLEGDIEADEVNADLSGASDLTLRGQGRELNLSGSGSSSIDLRNYPVTEATVRLSGASNAEVQVTGELGVDLGGGSTLDYYGDPRLGDVRTSGGASLRRR